MAWVGVDSTAATQAVSVNATSNGYLSQTFRTPWTFDQVWVLVATYGLTTSDAKLQLRQGDYTGASTIIKEQTFVDVVDGDWVKLVLDTPGSASTTYHVRLYEVSGQGDLAWWSASTNVYADGTAAHGTSSSDGGDSYDRCFRVYQTGTAPGSAQNINVLQTTEADAALTSGRQKAKALGLAWY